jgi:nucleoside-diphosphate-sugar epimerase
MFEVMQRFKPNVVFHAAAYKHVPLMESNPLEAVRNNAIATRVTAETAAASKVERFVLISTDKAVNPQTVMGASKAMAEWIVEAAGAAHPGTRFASVRFGNVLASSGSVVPIFRRQIERGGPVTVTHPEMTRFFMTIPEAVQMVIRAGDIGAGKGEVFVLDMGEPVKIVDLAHNMIRLAGYEPETDIAVEFIGPRTGEKLHEVLFSSGEKPQPTAARRINRAVRETPLDVEWVESTLNSLEHLVLAGDEANLAERVVELIAARGGDAAAVVFDELPLAAPWEAVAKFSRLDRCDRTNRRVRRPRRLPGARRPRPPLIRARARYPPAARLGRVSARARGRAQRLDLGDCRPAGGGAAAARGIADRRARGDREPRNSPSAARGGAARTDPRRTRQPGLLELWRTALAAVGPGGDLYRLCADRGRRRLRDHLRR